MMNASSLISRDDKAVWKFLGKTITEIFLELSPLQKPAMAYVAKITAEYPNGCPSGGLDEEGLPELILLGSTLSAAAVAMQTAIQNVSCIVDLQVTTNKGFTPS